MRGGHAQAHCTAANETAHKVNIKKAAIFSRTMANHNQSQDGMLTWVLRRKTYDAVIEIAKREDNEDQSCGSSDSVDMLADDNRIPNPLMFKQLVVPLQYTSSWSSVKCPRRRVPTAWGDTFISNRVRLTRHEFLDLVCRNLELESGQPNMVRVLQNLRYDCFGSLQTCVDHTNRIFVGFHSTSPRRQDFVRIKGEPENNTCLSARILMFVRISGFSDDPLGITLPTELRHPPNNVENVTFALIRWLSPHPRSVLRDSKLRPVCPPPLDINHALWTFAKSRRPMLTQTIIDRHFGSYEFDGMTTDQCLNNIEIERKGNFDLVLPESFESYMNCTLVDNDQDTILETITLPF